MVGDAVVGGGADGAVGGHGLHVLDGAAGGVAAADAQGHAQTGLVCMHRTEGRTDQARIKLFIREKLFQ